MPNEVEIMPNEAVHDLVAELQSCTLQMDMLYLRVGAILSRIKDQRLYLSYADHTDTFQKFLRDIDVGIGASQADHLIRVFRTFGAHIGTRRIPFKRLLLVHPLVKDDETREHWMAQAENLPYLALRDEIAEAQGRTPVDSCSHPYEARMAYFKCSVCGAWVREES